MKAQIERISHGVAPQNRDLTGRILLYSSLSRSDEHREPTLYCTTPRPYGRLLLDWYDCGTAALIVGCLIAGVVCLLQSV